LTQTSQPEFGAPHLFEGEDRLMEAAMASAQGRNYLEFGLGGSTLAAIRAGFAQVVAVDTSLEWVAAARGHAEVAPRIANGSATLIHADIGPTRSWGFPASRERLDQWPDYIRAPWAEWSRRGALPDLVYVDGRFRVACCLSVALVMGGGPAPDRSGPRLLLHDVTEERPDYQRVFAFFDVVEQVNSLYLLQLKPRQDRAALVARLLDQQFDPA
jgi:hypothetical protein